MSRSVEDAAADREAGVVMRRHRHVRGLRLVDVARVTSHRGHQVSVNRLSKIENGVVRANAAETQVLAEVYDISIEALTDSTKVTA